MKKVYLRDGRAPIPKREVTSKVMSSIRAKNTKPEIALRKALWKNGLQGYRLHWKKVAGRPDIAYPKRKIAIFVNGCYWHRCPHCNPSFPKTNKNFWQKKFQDNAERDQRKNKELKKDGWIVIVVWECQIKDNMNRVIHKIEKIIDRK
jgi:DNA mismatch endonuclease, patch repair protein